MNDVQFQRTIELLDKVKDLVAAGNFDEALRITEAFNSEKKAANVEIEKRIRKVLGYFVDEGVAEELRKNDRVKERLQLDSLDDVELVMSLEDEFGVEIPDEDAAQLVTINDAIALMKNLGVSAEGVETAPSAVAEPGDQAGAETGNQLQQSPLEEEGLTMAASESAQIKRIEKIRDSEKGKSLGDVGPKAHVADIVYHGEKLILPSGMAIMDAVGLLLDKQEHLEKPISFNEKFDALPFDGAYAINEVLAAKYGWAQSVATPGFFGPQPPAMINVAVGVGQVKTVPWGSFSIPGVDGRIETGVAMNNGRFQFTLSAQIKRKDEETVREIFRLVRVHLKENSIYRGQALKIRFKDDAGKPLAMPEPEFIDTSKIDRAKLIYSADVMDAVETNLFAPIERVEDFVANGLPVKRTVMLAGTYGTGKTLAATVASKIATENGITYIYCARADELTEALEFARQYQSPASVVFCEDIDRELDGERDAVMDDMLNLIDGIDTKHSNIITVLTSNAIEKINAAMLRPGRLDAIIDVTPPDAQAVVKLIRSIAGEAIDTDTNLDAAGAVLEGQIPAVISEVVKRAKIVQLRRQPKGSKVTKLGEDAVLEAAKTMAGQLTLLKNAIANGEPVVPNLDAALVGLVRGELRKTLKAELVAPQAA